MTSDDKGPKKGLLGWVGNVFKPTKEGPAKPAPKAGGKADPDKPGPGPGDEDEDKKKPVEHDWDRDLAHTRMADSVLMQYAAHCLDRFADEIRTAISQVERGIADRGELAGLELGQELGVALRDRLMRLCGRTPIGHQLTSVLDEVLRASYRDPTALLRAAESGLLSQLRGLKSDLPRVLGREWSELRSAASDERRAFIPMMHQAGLPSPSWSAFDLSRPLLARVEHSLERDPQKVDAEEKTEDEKNRDADLFFDETKKAR